MNCAHHLASPTLPTIRTQGTSTDEARGPKRAYGRGSINQAPNLLALTVNVVTSLKA